MITSIHDLPMNVFITCMCDADYSGLGEGTEEERGAGWDTIYREYVEGSLNATNNPTQEIYDKLEKKFLQYHIVENCVSLLRTYKSQELVDILKQNGYIMMLDDTDMGKWHKQLDKIMAKAKKLLIEIENGKHQLEGMQKSANKGQKVDRAYYSRCLSIFSKFQGGYLDEKQITVGRYIAVGNLYLEHIDAITESTNKSKSNGR